MSPGSGLPVEKPHRLSQGSCCPFNCSRLCPGMAEVLWCFFFLCMWNFIFSWKKPSLEKTSAHKVFVKNSQHNGIVLFLAKLPVTFLNEGFLLSFCFSPAVFSEISPFLKPPRFPPEDTPFQEGEVCSGTLFFGIKKKKKGK